MFTKLTDNTQEENGGVGSSKFCPSTKAVTTKNNKFSELTFLESWKLKGYKRL